MISRIFNENKYKNVFLAPMAGFTDLAFRAICDEYKAKYSVTEMVSCKAISYKNEKTKTLYTYKKLKSPQGIQLFGNNPSIISQVIKDVVNDLEYDVIDFNMACPVPKIFKNNEGSALMQDSVLASKIVSEAVKVSKKPISVKIRLGVTKDKINASEFAKVLEEAGASFIAIHGRTRDMYYSGKAMIDEIAKVKQAINIPLIANGDIFKPEDAENMFKQTNCDAIMLGRGALGKPHLFKQIEDYFKTGIYSDELTASEIVDIIKKQYLMMKEYKPEKLALLEMRKHSHRYIKGLYGASSVKDKINKANTEEEFFTCLDTLASSTLS